MKTTFTVTILGLVAASTFGFWEMKRYPALSHKEQVLRGPASHAHKVHAKVSGQYEVEIRSLQSPVAEAGDQILLEATITSLQDVDAAYFAWNLPEGVLPTSAITGELGPLHVGETKTVTLQAVSATEENKHIHLHVYKMEAGEKLGSMTQYNTRDQEKIEARLRTKAENLAIQNGASENRQKIMQ